MKDFVNIAIEKANHHAKEVLDTIPNLYNELVNVNTNFKKWRTTCLWLEVSNKPYYISYDHEAKQILLKDKNCHGDILFRFDDDISTNDISVKVKSL